MRAQHDRIGKLELDNESIGGQSIGTAVALHDQLQVLQRENGDSRLQLAKTEAIVEYERQMAKSKSDSNGNWP